MTDVRRSYLSGGHVYCTLRHSDVEIDECLGCRRRYQHHRRARLV